MFKKATLSLFIINILFANVSLMYAAQTAEQRAAQTNQITNELGIKQDAWFSNSKRTVNFISGGLFQIDALNDSLKAKGVSDTDIAKYNTEMIAALKEFAKASHAQENNGIFTTDSVEHERDAKLLETKGKFEQTIANVSKENGLDEQAVIYTEAAEEMQKLANESYVKAKGEENYVDLAKQMAVEQIKSFATVEGDYTLLAPVETFFPGGKIDLKGAGLSGYLNGLYRAGIAIATGLALMMIVVGGLEYVSTDSIQGKSNGRERIKNAIIGLLLALTSFIILRQINPNLLKSDLGLDSTGSTGTVNSVDVALSNGNAAIDPLTNYPYTAGVINNALSSAGVPGVKITGTKITPRGIPNTNWSAYALDLIKKSNLMRVNPIDAANFFPAGRITAEGWLYIVGGIIEKESSFNPRTTYQEPLPPLGPGTLSVGLMQMSTPDPEARAKRYTNEDLKDPLKNLEVGIGRLSALVTRDNCISCKSSGGSWRGGAAYWSVLRP